MLNAPKLFFSLMVLNAVSFCVTSRVYGQEKPAAPSKTEIFADFESGNYDGWTLEGNAFGTAPASDMTFHGKITGFGGKGFVCTLDPKLGNNATGKATSKAFTIDKPFIDFKIGGGRYPKEACLNLIVDGKIVRTETGNDSPNLVLAYWDVYAFIGKKAHIEIVDTTASTNRGYIMVDEIQFHSDTQRVPVITLRLQIIQVTDDDGSNAVSAKREEIFKALVELNKAYAPANVRFVWNPDTDFSVIRNTYLGRDFDLPPNIEQYTQSTQKPPELNIGQHYNALQKASLSYPNKVPIFLIRGIQWRWDATVGQWKLGQSGLSHGQPNFVFCRATDGGLWTHELGHLFGLVHTADFDSLVQSFEEVVKRISDNIAKGTSVKNGADIFDLDQHFGVLDTLPDPGKLFHRRYKIDKPFQVYVDLPNGRKQMFTMDCRNPMGGAKGDFSPDQCRIIRANAEMWLREGGAYPINSQLVSVL